MKKRSYHKVLFWTLLTMAALAATVFWSVRYTSGRMTAFSFQRLKEMTEDVAQDYREQIEDDRANLSAMARVFALEDLSDTRMTAAMLKSFDREGPYVEYQLLMVDGMLLDMNGRWTDVSDRVDFAGEAALVPFVSGRRTDFLEPDRLVVHHGVPVTRNGKTIAILYGVMFLQEASDAYVVNDFEGRAHVMVVDGGTGDVLIDTWHERLGNMRDYEERDFRMGDTVSRALDKMGRDQSGTLGFISESRGTMIYIAYEPVGYEHLSACVVVEEAVALEGTATIVRTLYTMMLILAMILLAYTVYIVRYLLRINRETYQLSITDQNTGLLNRCAYETHLEKNRSRYFTKAACVYVDANGLHELNNRCGHAAGDAMLQAVADALREQWPDTDIYRIGGDEFVLFPADTDEASFQSAAGRLRETLARKDYSISVGFARRERETGLDRLVEEADEEMLRVKAEHYRNHDRRTPR